MSYMAKSDRGGWVTFEKIEKAAEKIRRRDPSLTKEQSISKGFRSTKVMSRIMVNKALERAGAVRLRLYRTSFSYQHAPV